MDLPVNLLIILGASVATLLALLGLYIYERIEQQRRQKRWYCETYKGRTPGKRDRL